MKEEKKDACNPNNSTVEEKQAPEGETQKNDCETCPDRDACESVFGKQDNGIEVVADGREAFVGGGDDFDKKFADATDSLLEEDAILMVRSTKASTEDKMKSSVHVKGKAVDLSEALISVMLNNPQIRRTVMTALVGAIKDNPLEKITLIMMLK